jgi:hypothetical protein
MHAIHAIAQTGWLGAVIKGVTNMAATPAVVNAFMEQRTGEGPLVAFMRSTAKRSASPKRGH